MSTDRITDPQPPMTARWKPTPAFGKGAASLVLDNGTEIAVVRPYQGSTGSGWHYWHRLGAGNHYDRNPCIRWCNEWAAQNGLTVEDSK